MTRTSRAAEGQRLVAAPHVEVDFAAAHLGAGVHHRPDPAVAIVLGLDANHAAERQQRRIGGGHPGAHRGAGRGRLALAVRGRVEAERGAEPRPSLRRRRCPPAPSRARSRRTRRRRAAPPPPPPPRVAERRWSSRRGSPPARSARTRPAAPSLRPCRTSTQPAVLGDDADAGERGGGAGPYRAQPTLGAGRHGDQQLVVVAGAERGLDRILAAGSRTSAARRAASGSRSASMRAPTPEASASWRIEAASPSLTSMAARAARAAARARPSRNRGVGAR